MGMRSRLWRVSILHPIDPADLPRLHRQALLKPTLYAELAERLGGKKVPDAAILGNLLFHHYQITTSAKQTAAEAFLESARFAGTLGDDQVFHPDGPPAAQAPRNADSTQPEPSREPAQPPPKRGSEVRLDLRLWDADEGKVIRLRRPSRSPRRASSGSSRRSASWSASSRKSRHFRQDRRSLDRSSSFVPPAEFVRASRRVRLFRRSSSFVPPAEFVRASRRVRSYRH